MNETTILLSPSPGDANAIPDFLATVEPSIPRDPPFSLPFELVFDGYTREPWSSYQQHKQHTNSNAWKYCYLVSTDGRNRIPGFLKYLRERKKSAVAKFEATEPLPSPGGKSILVVPHDPPPIPTDLPAGVDANNLVFVKYLRDDNVLKKRKEVQKTQQQKQHQHQQQQILQQKRQQLQPPQKKKIPPQPTAHSSTKRGGGGLLGSLLGKASRTENHLHVVRSNKKSNEAAFDPTTGVAGCINDFRTKLSAELERFKSDPTTFNTKVSIDLASLVRSVSADEREKLTIDAFKFTVYEQVEEIGGEGWIAAKEPSEFLDECVIVVYKEGHCPPEVLEDMNKGELPDEIKGQTRHLVEAQSKAIQRKGKKQDEQNLRSALGGTRMEGTTELNTNKRDRRTLEQIQKDIQGEEGSEDTSKKGRFE